MRTVNPLEGHEGLGEFTWVEAGEPRSAPAKRLACGLCEVRFGHRRTVGYVVEESGELAAVWAGGRSGIETFDHAFAIYQDGERIRWRCRSAHQMDLTVHELAEAVARQRLKQSVVLPAR